MNRWERLAIEFKDMGDNLRIECLNMQKACIHDRSLEKWYQAYALLLANVRSQQQILHVALAELGMHMTEVG